MVVKLVTMGSKTSRRDNGLLFLLFIHLVASTLLNLNQLNLQYTQLQGWKLVIGEGGDVDGTYAAVERLENVTRITLSGFIGTPTIYGDLLRICNIGQQALNIKLKLVEVRGPREKLRVFRIYHVKGESRERLLVSLPAKVESEKIVVVPGKCVNVAVEVLVDASTRLNETTTVRIDLINES